MSDIQSLNGRPDRNLERQCLDILGYSAPLPLADPARVAGVLSEQSHDSTYQRNPHSRSDAIVRLLADPGLLTAVARLCRGNFRIWRSAIFRKSEGSSEIGWHHDKHFYADGDDDIHLEEIGTHFSVLFGLTDIVQNNGMIEMIPGSHRPLVGFDRDIRPYHKRPPGEHILASLPDGVLARARPVPIPAGCFVIFHSALLHRSLPHSSGGVRYGLAIRLVRGDVGVPQELAEPDDVLNFPAPVN